MLDPVFASGDGFFCVGQAYVSGQKKQTEIKI